jgi:hypothetical protein
MKPVPDDRPHEGRGAPASDTISTRLLLIIIVSVGGAVLAATSIAWATGLAVGVALLTVLRELVGR